MYNHLETMIEEYSDPESISGIFCTGPKGIVGPHRAKFKLSVAHQQKYFLVKDGRMDISTIKPDIRVVCETCGARRGLSKYITECNSAVKRVPIVSEGKNNKESLSITKF